MAITVTEFYESREVERTTSAISITDIFTVQGTGDPRVAEGYGPSFGALLDHGGITTTVQSKKAVRIAPDACRLTVIYGVPGGIGTSGTSGESWEMDLTAGTEHIVEVRETKDQINYPAEEEVGKAIGLIPSGRINGVDVYRPKATLTVTKHWEATAVSQNFLQVIYELTGKINNAVFKGWQPGSLLFFGARVRSAQEGFIPVVYTFLGSPRETNIKIDIRRSGKMEPITIKEKRGWDYLWLKQVTWQEGAEGEKRTMVATGSAHVAEVYEYANFAVLKLNPELV